MKHSCKACGRILFTVKDSRILFASGVKAPTVYADGGVSCNCPDCLQPFHERGVFVPVLTPAEKHSMLVASTTA